MFIRTVCLGLRVCYFFMCRRGVVAGVEEDGGGGLRKTVYPAVAPNSDRSRGVILVLQNADGLIRVGFGLVVIGHAQFGLPLRGLVLRSS